MKTKLTTPLLVGAAIVATMLLASPAPSALAQEDGGRTSPFGRKMKLGVIEMDDIFKEYVRAKRLEDRINQEKKGLEDAIEKQRDRIIKLRKDAEFLTGDALQDAEDEISIEVARLRLMKQRAEVTLKKKFEEYTTRVLGEIAEVVEEYGKKHDYTLILKVDSRKWGEDRLQAALRSVLFHSKTVDITDTVLTILNGSDWLAKMDKRDREEAAEKVGEGEGGG